MNLIHLCDGEFEYTRLALLDYEAGGQIYATLEGSINGDRLAGDIHLTNLGTMRTDNVNMPAHRGVLSTHDGAKVFVTIDGMALTRASNEGRLVAAGVTFRTGDERYAWTNTIYAVAEGVLDTLATDGVLRMRMYVCQPTIEAND